MAFDLFFNIKRTLVQWNYANFYNKAQQFTCVFRTNNFDVFKCLYGNTLTRKWDHIQIATTTFYPSECTNSLVYLEPIILKVSNVYIGNTLTWKWDHIQIANTTCYPSECTTSISLQLNTMLTSLKYLSAIRALGFGFDMYICFTVFIIIQITWIK